MLCWAATLAGARPSCKGILASRACLGAQTRPKCPGSLWCGLPPSLRGPLNACGGPSVPAVLTGVVGTVSGGVALDAMGPSVRNALLLCIGGLGAPPEASPCLSPTACTPMLRSPARPFWRRC